MFRARVKPQPSSAVGIRSSKHGGSLYHRETGVLDGFVLHPLLLPTCSKFLEAFPSDCSAWTKFAGLEASVGETERARAVFELAIRQPVLDMPETLWKEYIDFEVWV